MQSPFLFLALLAILGSALGFQVRLVLLSFSKAKREPADGQATSAERVTLRPHRTRHVYGLSAPKTAPPDCHQAPPLPPAPVAGGVEQLVLSGQGSGHLLLSAFLSTCPVVASCAADELFFCCAAKLREARHVQQSAARA